MHKYDASQFDQDIATLASKKRTTRYDAIYGVPRGGVNVAIALSRELNTPLISNLVSGNILVVDDVVDSGKTRNRFKDFDFACLHFKPHAKIESDKCLFYVHQTKEFINYFWEENEQPAEDAVIRLIQLTGDNPNRKGVIETPKRVVNSFKELFVGYYENPEDVFKTFEDEEEQFGGLVYLKDIEFYSMCEHHMLPFYGSAFIAYIPNGPVIGASKMARLLDIFSRRLQMQERIGEQVTNALMKYLNPKGAACLTEAKHLCIACRGVKKQQSVMGYSSLKGAFLNDLIAKNELMMLWGKR